MASSNFERVFFFSKNSPARGFPCCPPNLYIHSTLLAKATKRPFLEIPKTSSEATNSTHVKKNKNKPTKKWTTSNAEGNNSIKCKTVHCYRFRGFHAKISLKEWVDESGSGPQPCRGLRNNPYEKGDPWICPQVSFQLCAHCWGRSFGRSRGRLKGVSVLLANSALLLSWGPKTAVGVAVLLVIIFIGHVWPYKIQELYQTTATGDSKIQDKATWGGQYPGTDYGTSAV